MGILFWKNGELLEALVAFRKVLRVDPENRETLFAQAAISIERGYHHKGFEILFDIGCPETPINPAGNVIDRKTFDFHSADFPEPYDRADWNHVFEETEKKIRIDSTYRESRLKEGLLCLEQKCYEKAIRIFTRLAVLEPRNAIVRLHRAMALSARRKDFEAEREFSEAIMLQPRNAAAYKGLAQVRVRCGDDEKARSAFEQVIAINPDDIEAQQWLARVG